ncbi:MAG: DUF3344 domain-containing protein [Methanofollis sp.]|uniref:DUF3344 domain-containing protein n=1 Tax=Methanofollis sp. TaxID=2052835 RepID=UPI0026212BCE|nr:DUF3344 domain-containing protein [Methanofollis sp.]MDD4254371.1 DUF3344 domain-containing protein [Methanofollis sp.]
MAPMERAACLLLLLLLLPVCAAADQYVGGIPLTTVEDGVVSGGVYVRSFVGKANERDVSETFTLPEYTTVKWARLYTSVYCGHMQNNYEHRATVQFDGGSGMRTLGVEDLRVPYSFPIDEGTGPVAVNDHCNRVTSDYLMWYDVTDAIRKGTVTAHVKTEQPEGFKGTFDGRIKIVTLVVAYDDGDGDEVYYWVNQGHDVHSYYVEEYLGETYEGETTFDTAVLPEDDEREYAADLSIVHMASQVGEFSFNDEDLDADPSQGAYSGYQTWDVTAEISPEKSSELTYTRDLSVSGSGGGYLGAFFKIPLAVLTVKYPEKDVGGLAVTSSPAGATIVLDDEQTSRVTNATINGIAAGDHMVRVELDRYRIPDDRSVEVKKGANTTVHFDLQPITGSIEVTSEPSGAWVYLDGGGYNNQNMSVQTPATLDGLIIGEYTVEARLNGQCSYKTVPVLEDETAVVDLVFGSSGGDSDGSIPDYGYTGMPLKTYQTGTLHGNVSYYEFSSYTGLIHAGESREFSIDIPSNDTVGLARLYIYTTWGHDETLKKGTEQRITLKVDGIVFPADRVYGDRKNEGVYDYLLETFAYNVTCMKGGVAGTHTVTVTNDGRKDDVFATYGVGVLVVTEDPALPEITYWIDEGSDTLYANPDFGTTNDDCITTAPFNGTVVLSGIGTARLILISTAASGEDNDEHRITFNDGEWFNLLTGGSSAISVAELDVRPYLVTSGNLAGIQSYITTTKGDYMENRGAVLVVRKGGAVAGNETTVSETETATVKRPSAGSNTRVALNESGGRLGATRLLSDDGTFEVFIPEGTVITDDAGKRVTVLTLKSSWVGDNWSCTIGDADLQTDISLLLVVHTGRLNLSGTFGLLGPDGHTVETTSEESDLSARITRGGVYTLVPGGKEQPEKTFADQVSDFFGGVVTAILGIFGVHAEEKVVSVERNETVPTVVETIAPAATETPVDISSMTFAVSLLSNPPGALVDLDGEYLGKTTPVTITAAGGDHVVRMRLEGADPVEKTIHLAHDDELALDFETIGGQQFDLDSLRAWDANRYGGVYVDSFPEGAEIYVDGKKTGRKTPWLAYGLKEGLHTIKVKLGKVEFASEKESVWVHKNAVSSVTFTTGPEGIACSISVDSNGLSGCPFSVKGRYLGYKLPKKVEVGGGINRYVTVCVNGSYISEKVSDFMASNGTLTIRKDVPTPCSVMVASKPVGADIFVDGFATGVATPYCIENLSPGRHLISVSKPGYAPAERTVMLVGAATSGPSANVDLRMVPYAYGSLTVDSTSPGAKIYLFGKDTGEKTPFSFYYIPIGSYDVKVVSKDGSKTVEDVVVEPYTNTECRVDLSKQ